MKKNLEHTVAELLEQSARYKNREGYYLMAASPQPSFYNPNPKPYVVRIHKKNNMWLKQHTSHYDDGGLIMKDKDWNNIEREATPQEITQFKKKLARSKQYVDKIMPTLRSLD